MFMCIFFFKQKTAYEMRISDWSSDVCSSDLVTAKLKNTRNILRSTEFFLICCETATIFSMDSSLSARAVALAAEQARPEAGAGAGLRASALIGEGEPLGSRPPRAAFFTQFGTLLPHQIGRASRRGEAWPDVVNTWASVS